LWQVEAFTDICRQTPNKFNITPLVKNNSVTNVAFVTPQDEHGVLGKSATPFSFGDALCLHFTVCRVPVTANCRHMPAKMHRPTIVAM